MKCFYGILAGLITCASTHAQVAEKTLHQFRRLNNISCEVRSAGTNIFTGELFTDTLSIYLTHGADGNWIFRRKGTREDRWFYNNKLVILDPAAKTYRIKLDTMHRGSIGLPVLALMMDQLEINLEKKHPLETLPDTVIRNQPCSRFRITTYQMEKKGKRCYNSVTFAVEKKGLLPLYYLQQGAGFIDGTDVYINQHDEYSFSNYKPNNSRFMDITALTLPADYVAETPSTAGSMLQTGVDAPDIRLTDLTGKHTSLKDLRGKTVLLMFTDNGCGYCAMSIEPVNQLYASYKNRGVEVVNVNAFDTPEAIAIYNKKYKVAYNSFKPGSSTVQEYRVQGYPKFYVVDAVGKITKGYSGYSNDLQQQLSAIIDSSLAR
ncbi:MAG: TlpA family protein disulfide reductase [Chitinophagaceae bacterium]|nr:MAG: TlpA family protein disulfide reductase [Chitinophagaceae bacterium]